MAPAQLFLSCVSAEFGSYRDGLRHNLHLPDVAVKVQEYFIAGGVPTLDKLDTSVSVCRTITSIRYWNWLYTPCPLVDCC